MFLRDETCRRYRIESKCLFVCSFASYTVCYIQPCCTTLTASKTCSCFFCQYKTGSAEICTAAAATTAATTAAAEPVTNNVFAHTKESYTNCNITSSRSKRIRYQYCKQIQVYSFSFIYRLYIRVLFKSYFSTLLKVVIDRVMCCTIYPMNEPIQGRWCLISFSFLEYYFYCVHLLITRTVNKMH